MAMTLLAYFLIALNIKKPFAVSGFGNVFLLSHVLYGAILIYVFLVLSLKDKFPRTKY
jgi:hypothetical protein